MGGFMGQTAKKAPECHTTKFIIHTDAGRKVEVDAPLVGGKADAVYVALVAGVKKSSMALRVAEDIGKKIYVARAIEDRFLMQTEPGDVVLLSAEEKPLKHSSVGCDSCGKSGLTGVRYHCPKCADADFCQECVENGSPASLLANHTDAVTRIYGAEFKFDREDHELIRKTTCTRYMTKNLRKTVWETHECLFKNGGELRFVGTFHRRDGKLKLTWQSYKEVHEQVVSAGAGMRHLRGAGGVVGTFITPCVEAIVVDFASIGQKMIFVPIHTNLTVDTLEGVVRNSGVKLIAADSPHATQLAKIDPSLLQSITLVLIGNPRGLDDDSKKRFHSCVPYDALLRIGADHPSSPLMFTPDEPCSLCYTSGSSGDAKGAVLTESLHLKDIYRGVHSLQPTPYVTLLYLPLSHMMGRGQVSDTLTRGGQLAILHENDMANLYECAGVLHPTKFNGVPSVFGSLMAEYNAERHLLMMNGGEVGCAKIVEVDDAAPRGGNTVGITRTDCQEYRDRLEVLKNVAEQRTPELDRKYSLRFGARLQKTAVGSAKVPKEMVPWLRKIFRVTQEGYGTTEVGAIATNGVLSVPHKLIDVPELGYSTADKPYPRGELLVKTSDMIPGYYNSPELNKKFFDKDGYFRTGDIVELRDQMYVEVIDRRGNIEKIAGGEFIAPESLAASLCTSPFVEQVYVHINSTPSGVGCVVVPTQVGLKKDEKFFLNEFEKIVVGERRPKHEVPSVVVVAGEKFTSDNGCLTPSKKICRHGIRKKYNEALSTAFEKQQSAIKKLLNEASSCSPDVDEEIREIFKGEGVDFASGVSLSTLGLDSLTLARLSGKLKKKLKTSHQNVLEKLLRTTTISPDEAGQKVAADYARLSSKIRQIPLGKPTPSKEGCYLLTGATGIVGRSVLSRLIAGESSKKKIYCVTRNVSSRKDSLVFYSHPLVVYVEGDVAKPQLGMSPETYREVVGCVEMIYHAAAKVSWVAGYDELRGVNVEGTGEVLVAAKLAGANIVYVSTVSVAGPGSVEHAGWEAGRGKGYSSSKELAELLVRTSGVASWSVSRLCFVSPCTTDPHRYHNPTDALYRVASTLHLLGLRLSTPSTFPVAPAEAVASHILSSPPSTTTTIAATSHVAFEKLNPSGTLVTPEDFIARCHEDTLAYPLVGFLPGMLRGGDEGVGEEVSRTYNMLFE